MLHEEYMQYEDPNDPHWYHESAVSVKDMVLNHDSRIDKLERRNDRLDGAFSLLKFAIGASAVSTAVSIIGIIIGRR